MVDHPHVPWDGGPLVGSSMWGTPNGVTMVTNYDSLTDFETASDAIQEEGSFLDRLEGSVGRPETIQTWVMRRIT